MKLKILFLYLCSIWLFACTEEMPAVHPLQHLGYVEANDGSGEIFTIKKEYFIISNAPADKVTLEKLVQADINNDEIPPIIAKHLAYFRIYYKESSDTPRDYKEENKGYFDHDYIGNHEDDLILIVAWKDHGKTQGFEFYNE